MICFLARNKPSRVVPNQRLSSPSLYVDKISALSNGGGTAAFLSSNSFCIEGKSTSHSEPSASFATSPSRELVIKDKGYFGNPSRSSKTAVTRPFSARATRPSAVISQTLPFDSCATGTYPTGEPSESEKLVQRPLM